MKYKIFLFLFLISFFIFTFTFTYNKDITMVALHPDNLKMNIKTVDASTLEEDYLLELIIPKINLKEKVYKIDSSKNNVDLHIQILKESTMPDGKNSSIFLAAHRGNTKVSYFENLHKLEKGDSVYIDYKKVRYIYTINDFFLTEKNGTIPLTLENKDSITLITCDKNDKTKQLVFIGYKD